MATPSAAPPAPAAAPGDDQLQLHQFQLTSLDEQGVASLFASLGFPFYQAQLKDHGITGDILVHLDHEALRDVGIHSVGQRLAILRAVYRLKVEQNIPVEEGGWVPPSEEMEDMALFDSPVSMTGHGGGGGGPPTAQMMNLLGERDDRIRILESEVQKLHDTLLTIREDVMRPASKPPRPSTSLRSPTSTLFPSSSSSSSSHTHQHPHPLSNQSTLSRNNSTTSKSTSSSTAVNIGLAGAAGVGGGMPDSPRSPMESPRMGGSHQQQQEDHPHHGSGSAPLAGPVTPTTPTAPSLLGGLGNERGGGGGDHYYSSSSSQSTLLGNPSSAAGGGGLTVPSSRPTTATTGDHQPREQHPRDVSSSSISHHPSRHTTDKDRDANAKAQAQADNPYRSFRVTLEDPCHKVLPAALKKYKINDDWRQYALFICYGNTERCLAYDEKPLLLFQRLKESNNNPVFMLRHIKDIKSPIAVASAKHAARREKRGAGVGGGVEGRLTVNRDGVSVQGGGGAGAGAGGNRPTRLHHPPVLLPVGKDKEAAEGKKDEGAPPPPSPREAPGYCISIYPYLAEREDEFDVTVGDTFVIISKTKGWWVVHRDLPPSPNDTTPRKSAWVPAGCLLETSVPPLSLAPPSLDLSSLPPGNAATVPIEPQYVVSVSTPNVALMDYEKVGSDELEVRKGTGVRILKRYNHWSYAIKEDGQRGWIPSWFCGRASRTGDGTPTTPTTAEGRAATSDARGLSRAASSGGNGRERSTSSAATKERERVTGEEDGEATLVGGE